MEAVNKMMMRLDARSQKDVYKRQQKVLADNGRMKEQN